MIGKLGQYIGSAYPEMAGLQGRVHAVGSDAFGNALVNVRWCGRFGHVAAFDSRPIPFASVRPIKRFSKGVIAESQPQPPAAEDKAGG